MLRQLPPSCTPSIGPTTRAWPRTLAGAAANTDRRVRLRPLRDEDLELLFAATATAERGDRWRSWGAAPTPQALAVRSPSGVRSQFVVEGIACRTRFGLVRADDARDPLRCASLDLVRFAGTAGRSEAIEGLAAFTDFVLRAWPFSELRVALPELDAAEFVGTDRTTFGIERGHHPQCFADGRWWDQLTVVIDRPAWHDQRGRWPFLGARNVL